LTAKMSFGLPKQRGVNKEIDTNGNPYWNQPR
jgi:hypothetical protein